MLLIEKEAKEKICPSLNSQTNQPPCCKASQCMAWRWAWDSEKELPFIKTNDKGDVLGYCGLVGKPE